MAILYALCSLLFAAFNDLAFKLYARKSRARGLYFAMIGLAWAALLLPATRTCWDFSRTTLAWGIISGFFSVAANLLLIEAMAREEAGICATIYRLNLVAVVIGAAALLGEELNAIKFAGIAMAAAAVFLFANGEGRRPESGRRRYLGIALVLAAALFRAAMGLSYKYAFLHNADRMGIILLNSFCWIAGGLLYTLLREPRGLTLTRSFWGYGLVSGALVTGIVLFMALSLQYGDAAVVLPIAQMSFIATALLGVAFLHESLQKRKVLGMLFGTLAILLLSCG